MRRSDKEITDKVLLEEILEKAITCRIGMCDGDIPYVVPVNFSYKDECIYFHSAKTGKKLDIIKENNNICFEIDIDNELVQQEKICNWGCKYYSIIGFGKAYLIEDNENKRNAMDVISGHYSGKEKHEFSEEALNRVVVIKIEIESMTGKKSGY